MKKLSLQKFRITKLTEKESLIIKGGTIGDGCGGEKSKDTKVTCKPQQSGTFCPACN